jgi:hypothetical protein
MLSFMLLLAQSILLLGGGNTAVESKNPFHALMPKFFFDIYHWEEGGA